MERLEQVPEVNIGTLKEYKVQTEKTVASLLEEFNLSGKYFTVIVNGKRASPDTVVKAGDSIIILPKIAGG